LIQRRGGYAQKKESEEEEFDAPEMGIIVRQQQQEARIAVN
jgi:hypothetical protein